MTGGQPLRKFAVAIAIAAFGPAAYAAGIDSRAYTCGGLHQLIAARGFVYIGIPFQDFAVANGGFCSGNERLEARSVATSDNPECIVRYCETSPPHEGT
jgi:hypothetical protein